MVSGADGRFTLAPVPAGQHLIQVQRIGYESVALSATVPDGGTTIVDVSLVPAPLALDEIVVSGAAGGRRRREVGNVVTRLEIDDLTDRPATVSDFLQGAAAGIEVTGGSGEAGQGKQIRLRGRGSMLLSSQPLVYIDGVRMMEGAFPSEVFGPAGFTLPGGAKITTSPLDLVSVGDVERIEIAKGPAATTLFGTGSANGVIQIFTKRGTSGSPRWTADVSQGTGWVRPFGANGIDYLHVEHFLRDAWWGNGYEGGEASRDCVTDDPRWKGVNDSADGACSWPGAQWYQTYRLAVEGGPRRFGYFVSAEYQDDTYALPLDRLERRSVRANLTGAPWRRVEISLHTAYTDVWTSNTASGRNLEGILLSTLWQDWNALGSGDPRDIASLLDNRNDQWVDRFTAGLTTTFSQNARASHRLTLGYDYSRQNLRSTYAPGFTFPPPGVTTRTWDRHLRTIDYLGSYGFAPRPELRSTLSFGLQAASDELGWIVHSRSGDAGEEPTDPGNGGSVWTLENVAHMTTAGLYAQNVLGFRNRYFLTTGFRVDRHEIQDESFTRIDPRVGLAWVTSDEAFWHRVLGELRMRAAYGSSSIAPSPFIQTVRYFGGTPPQGSEQGTAVEPEVVTEWEAGFDAALLGGRLTIGLTRYVQTSTDALVPVTVDAQSIPQRQELRSIGEVRNHGIELQVDAGVVRGPDWTVDVGIGLGTNYSKAVDLGGAEAFYEVESPFVVGHPVPVSRGRRVAEPEAVNGPWSPDRYVTGANGNQRIPLGPQLPTHFLTPAISVRMPGGVGIAARGEYRGGHVRFVNPVAVGRRIRSPFCEPYYANPANPTNPEESLALRSDTPDLWRERCTPTAAQDYWFDADYFKLRSVSATVPVGFAFPDRVTDALFTVTLANAFTWYREVPWWDVEIPGNEGANGDGVGTSERVPAPTTITFGLRVRF